MQRYSKSTGKDRYATLPHEIGRQGAKFLPGGGQFKDRGSETNSWAGDIGKGSKKESESDKGDNDSDD